MLVNKDGELESTLITSVPVVVMINLHDFKVNIKVCPKLVKIVSHHGCHSCARMATVVIEALSTCLPGEVRVNIDSFPISTRVVQLETKKNNLKFKLKLIRNAYLKKYA